jgi:hypothetical protein
MRRIYFTNDSYPELRNIPRGWSRQRAWMRAFRSGMRDVRLWAFFAMVILIVVGCAEIGIRIARVVPVEFREYPVVGGFAVGLTMWCALCVTVGGDLIRPHLRRTTPECGESCPYCGYALNAHLGLVGSPAGCIETPSITHDIEILCPECGMQCSADWFGGNRINHPVS